jgi:hypothetical protein
MQFGLVQNILLFTQYLSASVFLEREVSSCSRLPEEGIEYQQEHPPTNCSTHVFLEGKSIYHLSIHNISTRN